jgi:hypothetical protein
MFRLYFIAMMLLFCVVARAQRKFVIASLESKTPQRDVQVSIDNGPEFRTPWHGQIEVPDSFKRIDFCHPKFQRRYVLRDEIHGDTIYLIPALNALDEVVIYGERRGDKRMADLMRPATPVEPQMPQVLTTGPNVLAMLGWLYDHTLGPKIADKQRRKKALKRVRALEQEYEQRWAALRDTIPHTTPNETKP